MKTLRLARYILCLVLIPMIFSCSEENSNEEIVDSNITNHSEMENELITIVNEYRNSLGLNQLSPLNEISSEASEHTYYMLALGQLSHDNFGQRYENLQQSVNANNVAENVGYGYNSAASFVNAWVNSPNHYGNIVGDFTHIGVAVAIDENNKFYVTQIYVNR